MGSTWRWLRGKPAATGAMAGGEVGRGQDSGDESLRGGAHSNGGTSARRVPAVGRPEVTGARLPAINGGGRGKS